jgi:hypothetical protein
MRLTQARKPLLDAIVPIFNAALTAQWSRRQLFKEYLRPVAMMRLVVGTSAPRGISMML